MCEIRRPTWNVNNPLYLIIILVLTDVLLFTHLLYTPLATYFIMRYRLFIVD